MNLRKYDLVVPESCSRSLFSRHVLFNPCGKSPDGRKKGIFFRGAGLGVFFCGGEGAEGYYPFLHLFLFFFRPGFLGGNQEEEEDWELLLLDDDVPSYHLILVFFFLQCPPDVLLSGGSYPDQVLNR